MHLASTPAADVATDVATASSPLSTALELGRLARGFDGERVSRFEVRRLVDDVADALRSCDDNGAQAYHICRASATALTLWASTRGLAGGRDVGGLVHKLRNELAALRSAEMSTRLAA